MSPSSCAVDASTAPISSFLPAGSSDPDTSPSTAVRIVASGVQVVRDRPQDRRARGLGALQRRCPQVARSRRRRYSSTRPVCTANPSRIRRSVARSGGRRARARGRRRPRPGVALVGALTGWRRRRQARSTRGPALRAAGPRAGRRSSPAARANIASAVSAPGEYRARERPERGGLTCPDGVRGSGRWSTTVRDPEMATATKDDERHDVHLGDRSALGGVKNQFMRRKPTARRPARGPGR